MKLVGTLLFTLLVICNAPESVSADQTKLRRLFPGSNGIDFPAIKEMKFEETTQFRNFQRFADRDMSEPHQTFLKRGTVIVGYEQGDIIKPLSLLFRKPILFYVYDTIGKEYVELSSDDWQQLGTNYRLSYIQARDRAAATHILTEQPRKQVHYEAGKQANIKANSQARIQTILERTDRATHQESIEAIEKAYHDAYNEIYEHFSKGRSVTRAGVEAAWPPTRQ